MGIAEVFPFKYSLTANYMPSRVGIVKINKTWFVPSRILLTSKRRPVSRLVSINVISDREEKAWEALGTLIRDSAD